MTSSPDRSMQAAREEIQAARLLIGAGWSRPAVSRTYYAAFYAVLAALRTVGETPGTHAGALSRFSFHFVRTGKIPAEAAAILGPAFIRRQDADYDS